MKKLFMFMILGIFFISLISASVDYEEQNKTYTIDTIIPNWLGGEGESVVKLINNTDECLIDCSFTLEFQNEKPVSLLEDFEFLNRKGEDIKNTLEGLTFEIGKLENITTTTPIYNTSCEKVYNSTINDYSEICNNLEIGNTTSTEQIITWKDYNGEEEEGLSYLRANAKKDISNSVDWIITFRGKKLVNWAWWNNSWSYKRQIIISNVSSNVNINYSVPIYLEYDNNMNLDFSDLRFTNSEETEELPYWIENKSNGNYANLWIKLNLNITSNTTIYIYYGNSLATSKSNIKQTFLLGDDFEDSSIDTNLWQTGKAGGGVVNENNGVLYMTSTNGDPDYSYIRTINTYGINTIATFKINVTATPNLMHVGYCNFNSATTHPCSYSQNWSDIVQWGSFGLRNNLGGTSSSIISMTSNFNNWDIYKVYRKLSNSNGTNLQSSVINSDSYPTIPIKMGWDTERGGEIKVDYTFIRHFQDSDPNYFIGNEEQNAGVNIDFITPPTPENYANSTNENITLKVNVTYSVTNFTNITYYLLNINGSEIIEYFENETYEVNFTLPTAHFHYNVTVCADSETLGTFCSVTETRHLNHDITPPEINVTSPRGTYNYLIKNYTLNLNWSVTDDSPLNDSISSCWFDYGNIDQNLSYSGSGNYTFDNSIADEKYLVVKTSRFNSLDPENPLIYTYNYDVSSCPTNVISVVNANGWSNLSCGNTSIHNFNFGTYCIDGCEGIFGLFIFDGYLNKFVNCSLNTTNIGYIPDKNNLTFYANDTFGNVQSNFTYWNYKVLEINQTFNNETTEGSLETYLATIKLGNGLSISDSVLFNYNGSSSAGQSFILGNNTILRKADFLIPNVLANTNATFYWFLTLSDSSQVNLSSKNQYIYNLAIDNCSSYSKELFNFTLVDEERQTLLTNSTIETAFNVYDKTRTNLVINYSYLFNNVNPVRICLNRNITGNTSYSLDSIVRYEAPDYANEYYNIVNQSINSATNTTKIILYDLNISDSTEFQLTFTGSDFLPVENALVYVDRQYISENTFKTVELPKTDYSGQTVLHLVRNDVIYNIRVIKDGKVLGNFESLTAFCDDYTIGDCNIELNAFDSVEAIFNYDTSLGILFTAPTYNANSSRISFNFLTEDGESKTVSLEVTRNDIFGNRSICNSTLTSSGGTLTCDIDPNIEDTNLNVQVLVNNILAVSSSVSLDSTGYGLAGYLVFVVMVISFALMFSGSKTGVLISIGLSFAGGIGLSLISGNLIGLGASGLWIIIIIIIGLIKLNKDKDP